jgi:Fic family protein
MTVLDEIAERKRAMDAARPLPQRAVDELASWFERELTVSTVLLEGARLSRDEAIRVMDRGPVLSAPPPFDQLLVVNHARALELQARLSYQPGGIVTERTVAAFHGVLYKGIDPRPGHYREGPLKDDLPVPAPDAPKTHVSMSALSGWLRRSDASPETAVEAHLRLRMIRPFDRGNAAVALLACNLILNRAGYPPIAIREDGFDAYHDALVQAMTEGDKGAYRETMLGFLRQSLDVCLVAAAGSLAELAGRAAAPRRPG